jgi:hypothetical protein
MQTVSGNNRLSFKKSSAYSTALVTGALNNLLSAKQYAYAELMNSSVAHDYLSKVGYDNILYVPDDNDYEWNDFSDSLSVTSTGTYSIAKNYVFGNSLTHPQVVQQNERLTSYPGELPGFYFTVAYEIEPNKYVQIIGLDNRSFRTGQGYQLRRTGATGAITDLRTIDGQGQSGVLVGFNRSYANGDTTLGKRQLLWLQDVLTLDNKVPAYTKAGISKNTYATQSQIYFRVLCNQTTMLSGLGFKDRLTGEETATIMHMLNGGQIVDNGAQVVACTGVYGSPIKGVICVASGNHLFEAYQAFTGAPTNYTGTFVGGTYQTVYAPYTVNEYIMSERVAISTNSLIPTGANSTNPFTTGTYDLNVRRWQGSQYSWNQAYQPTAIGIDFDLRVNGRESANVRVFSFGNLYTNINSNPTTYPQLLTGNPFDNQYSEIFSEILYYKALQPGTLLN